MATLAFITQQLELSEQLRAGRDTMIDPQDLPGRFGRVIHDIDRVLAAIDAPSVLAGGWAVWRHGYAARVTQDVDIVLPSNQLEEFVRTASVAGFQPLNQLEGRWPKVQHKATDITVDILPEGGRPGVPSRLAPTLIRHPSEMGGVDSKLRYITLPALIELKLAAGRVRDENDVIEMIRSNPDAVESIRVHLATIHPDYVERFDAHAKRAGEDDDR
jgi:hypothetical protein